MQANAAEMHQRALFKTITLNGSVYGGGGNMSRLPEESAYANLPRYAYPPGANRMLKEISGEGTDERVRFAVKCFCKNDLIVKWMEQPRNAFIVEGYLPDDDSSPVLMVRVGLETAIQNGYVFAMMSVAHKTEQNPPYHHLMTFKQKELLKRILLSRFLRSCGS
jgi:hypothetical protein